MKEKVADHLVSLIREQGIRHVFGVPSGGWLPYMDAMKHGDVDFVLVANEASAGFMATVYGWLTGEPGVCYATIGPGATNLSTGIGSALLDRSPVIALTTEPDDRMNGRTVQMAIDQQALMRPITKWSTRMHASNIDGTFRKAVQIATAEYPGPVHIGLPEDLWEQDVPAVRPLKTEHIPPADPDEPSLKAMESRFKKAQRPILAVGLTAVREDMGSQIAALSKRHNIPVVLTPMAKGLLDEEHPGYAGVLFHALSDQVALTHKQADLVVGIGYDPVEFNYESWMPEVGLIHIDYLPADIDNAMYPEVLDVVGNPVSAVKRLLDLDPINSGWDMKELSGRRAKMFDLMKPSENGFGPLAALEELRRALPSNGIMACDVGSHTHLIGQAWRTPHRFGQLMTNGWSSMGFGVPAAIGAKVARRDLPVACVSGDGGFMMMAGEMSTAQRLNLNIVFVVFADRSLELIRLKQKKRNMETYGTILSGRDVPAPGSIFGVPVVSVSDVDSYRQALDHAFKQDGPVVIEAVIDAGEYNRLILRKHK